MRMKVFITGSREANQAMISKVHEVVSWCFNEAHYILVGDAPGVDQAVREAVAAAEPGVICDVYGAYGQIRGPRPDTDAIIIYHKSKPSCTYQQRDEYLLKHADLVVAIWNGSSPGTLRNIQRAKELGKRVIVRKFT